MSKPNLDPNNPLVQAITKSLNQRAIAALSVPQNVERSIIPIFGVIKTDNKPKKDPQQIGSGVLVSIQSEYFIFSASHVFDAIGDHVLLTSVGQHEQIFPLLGDRYSTQRGVSGTHEDDPIDASVYHIKDAVPEKLKELALSLDHFDSNEKTYAKEFFLTAGFRVKRSKRIGKTVFSKRECFPSIELQEAEYKFFGLDPNIHILLACEKQVIIENRWQLAPKLEGISGGAIMRVKGISLTGSEKENPDAKQLLTAIAIQQIREKPGQMGVLVGTRVGVHLGLIQQFYPGLFSE